MNSEDSQINTQAQKFCKDCEELLRRRNPIQNDSKCKHLCNSCIMIIRTRIRQLKLKESTVDT